MTSATSTFDEGHELLYFVDTRLAGDDPDAILAMLYEHLEFLSDLDAQGKLVFAGPLDTLSGASSGNGIYALRVATLADARATVERDPLHRAGIRVARLYPWHRKKDWSVLPSPQDDRA
ncbi:YciI family protein [Mycobacterium sp.]|jgi:uncharacterized protein YciI|uniref:YciI family protein n=1 Tax=Mycobacterium sp. TaxID=1785 RepID=UPI003341F5E4|nr:hypothetical protein [Mycobacterium sp.]